MVFPEHLRYTAEHEWVRMDPDGRAVVGITEYARQQLGDIVFVELPQIGDTVAAGDTVATLESVKAVSSVYSPLPGTIDNINEELIDAPELIDEDPYAAWIVKLSNVGEAKLLTAREYAELVAQEAP